MGLVLQRALCIEALLLSPLSWTAWYYTENVLLLCGQDAGVSKLAGIYVRWSIPSLLAYAALESLKKYLLTQGIMKPNLVVGITGACAMV